MGSAGHSPLWGATTLVVIGYSYLLATVLPFFSELVRTKHFACAQTSFAPVLLRPERSHDLTLAAVRPC